MREGTLREVERWWRSQLAIGDGLWKTTTVHRRTGVDTGLGDQAWFVAWRPGALHVVVPSVARTDQVSALRVASVADLQEPRFWRSFAHQHDVELVGPNVYRYLDEDPGPAPGVHEVPPSELRALGAGVEPADLWDSGFDVHLDAPGVVAFAATGGGAVLTDVDGAPRNVALLVRPDACGRGLGTALGRAAASYAIRHHGWCRWRSSAANLASSRAAERLGFEAYANQLVLRSSTNASRARSAAWSGGPRHNDCMVSREEVEAMNAYLLKCIDLFEEVRGMVPSIVLADARSLLDHGEPAEGVSILAWVLVQEGVSVSPDLAARFRSMVLDPQDLPPALRD